VGVGQPSGMWLEQYGKLLVAVFGYHVYQTGSSLTPKGTYRDVDIRVILPDEEYAALGFTSPENEHGNLKWVAMCLAFAELGKRVTGLPIDFQIQQSSHANANYSQKDGHRRSALGVI